MAETTEPDMDIMEEEDMPPPLLRAETDVIDDDGEESGEEAEAPLATEVTDDQEGEEGETEDEKTGDETGDKDVEDEDQEESGVKNTVEEAQAVEVEKSIDDDDDNADEETDEDEEGPPTQNEKDKDKLQQSDLDDASTSNNNDNNRKRTANSPTSGEEPKRKIVRSNSNEAAGTSSENRGSHDSYCWVCHKEGVFYNCKICPRSYHAKCLCLPEGPDPTLPEGDTSKNCVCPECLIVMKAENVDSRSDAMKQLSMDELVSMLKYICGRLRSTVGVDPFLKPVNPEECTDYYDYIIYPMDITTLEKNIKQRQYGSTEAFLSDFQWIVHNSIVFNSVTSPYTAAAKRLLKVCKQELSEIETCPECYRNAHNAPKTWFMEACRRPHILVWAKLKGFPFWPAKAMKIKDDQVDVRFFGQHDRSWVAFKDCFLYSEEMPAAPPKKNGPLLSALDELKNHVEKLKEAHGKVLFFNVKTPLEGITSVEHIQIMFPEYQPDDPPQSTTMASPASSCTSGRSPGKSPMTITISSIKTNPTIVSNTLGEPTEILKDTKIIKQKTITNTNEELILGKESELVKKEEKLSTENEPKNIPITTTTEVDNRVPSGEILANALGLKRIVRKKSVEQKTSEPESEPEMKKLKVALMGGVPVKEEIQENIDENEEMMDITDHTNTNQDELGENLKSSSMKKGGEESSAEGYQKFNISKDISISTIEDEENDLSDGEIRLNKNTSVSFSRLHPSMKLPEGMQVVSQSQSPSVVNHSSHSVNVKSIPGLAGLSNLSQQQQQQQRFARNQDVQFRGVGNSAAAAASVGMKNLKTNQIQQSVNNFNKQRVQMARTMSPIQKQQQIMVNRGGQQKQGGNPIVVDSTSLRMMDKSSGYHHSQSQQNMPSNQQHQASITLPGGNITVTPLSALISANAPTTSPALSSHGPNTDTTNINGVLFKQQSSIMNTGHSSNGLPMNDPSTSAITATPINNNISGKFGKNSSAIGQQRRNMQQQLNIPPNVTLLIQNFNKTMNELMKGTVEQIALEIADGNSNSKSDYFKLFQQELDKLKQKHQNEIMDLKHNQEITLRELRVASENDKKRSMIEFRRYYEQEKQRAVEETKRKQWCANCSKEALFYCCWNNSYCGYQCQEQHWAQHMNTHIEREKDSGD